MAAPGAGSGRPKGWWRRRVGGVGRRLPSVEAVHLPLVLLQGDLPLHEAALERLQRRAGPGRRAVSGIR